MFFGGRAKAVIVFLGPESENSLKSVLWSSFKDRGEVTVGDAKLGLSLRYTHHPFDAFSTLYDAKNLHILCEFLEKTNRENFEVWGKFRLLKMFDF